MYESYFGLNERPFDLSPNPRFLFLSRRHSEALAHLRYGLSGRSGLTVLIGEAGTGKTTLVRAALQTALMRERIAVDDIASLEDRLARLAVGTVVANFASRDHIDNGCGMRMELLFGARRKVRLQDADIFVIQFQLDRSGICDENVLSERRQRD